MQEYQTRFSHIPGAAITQAQVDEKVTFDFGHLKSAVTDVCECRLQLCTGEHMSRVKTTARLDSRLSSSASLGTNAIIGTIHETLSLPDLGCGHTI